MNSKKKFNQIISDIKSIKIQGARNVAKSALEAYYLFPSRKTKNELLSLRPTEPMMENVLDLVEKGISKNKIIEHFNFAQSEINKNIFKLMKDKDKVFTHCHSTNVVNALIYSKKKGKKFEVFNTETRPLFQGRKTAADLENAKIKVTMFVDSALGIALKESNTAFLGADAILKEGVINKIGSGLIAETAYNHKIPVYIVADSWKFTKSKVLIEQRKLNEIWDKAPKNVKIKNPAFEFIPKKYIKAVVSELGVLKYEDFLRKV